MPTDPTRGLLCAIFAIHLNYITRNQLAAAIAEWIREPARPIAEILVAQKAIDQRTREIVEDVVARHLEQHQGDVEQSLANLDAKGLIPPELASVLGGSLTSAARPPASAGAEGDETSAPVSLASYASGGTRYRVLGPQERGGMGEVFVARDLELGRKVLLKQLPDRHADDPGHRASFLKEVRAGAALEHPNIAPVYDIGQYPGGRLFQVMRLIPGGTLARAIRDHHASAGKVPAAGRVLRFRELLGHFVDACQAIEYAHSRGVLHRDIKPNNIMLGSFGETQVIDWGLARIAGHDLSDGKGSSEEIILPADIGEGSQPTIEGQFKGTPAYASPEQADGKQDLIDARSDVYGLGATLYCLLTGEAPFHVRSPLILEDVKKGMFPRPRLMRADVPPALESICLKAMAKPQEDRYQSPRDLATEVERWLADEPVRAHPDPFSVRLRRWGLRHRTAVAAAAALLLTSVVGLGIGYAAVKEQRDVAIENSRVAAAAVRKFLLEYTNEVLPKLPNSERTRIKMVSYAVEASRTLIKSFPDEREISKVLARSLLELGDLNRTVGEREASEVYYKEATALFQSLIRRQSNDEDLQHDVIIALCGRCESIAKTEGPKMAEPMARFNMKMADEFPDSLVARFCRAHARWRLAETLAMGGDSEEACELMLEASQTLVAVVQEDDEWFDPKISAALIQAEAAKMFREAGRDKTAREYAESAVAAAEVLGNHPEADEMTTSFILAEALRERAAVIDRDLPNGLEDLNRSIGIMERLVKGKADVVYYRRLLVEVLCDRGTKLLGLGRQRESTADASRAVEEAEKLVAGMGATAEDGKVLSRARELRARMRDEVGAESDATSE
ncbi:MAG: serine/threonine-protein kinase [Planctomycetia bacterium]